MWASLTWSIKTKEMVGCCIYWSSVPQHLSQGSKRSLCPNESIKTPAVSLAPWGPLSSINNSPLNPQDTVTDTQGSWGHQSCFGTRYSSFADQCWTLNTSVLKCKTMKKLNLVAKNSFNMLFVQNLQVTYIFGSKAINGKESCSFKRPFQSIIRQKHI